MKQDLLKKILILIALLTSSIICSTLLYHFFEQLSLFESFYMTLITLSTVGFAEPETFGTAGRIITVFVIISSVTIVAYSATSLLKLFLEGELQQIFGRNRVNRSISKLKNHYIICGYGRVGRLIASELKNNNLQCVIIENNADTAEQINEKGLLFVNDDATSEETLIKSGIMNAKAIVTAVDSDADNVFIVLTARSLNPNIYIISRASEISTENKLKKAGANKVVLPHVIGGHRMAQALMRPTVVDFIDIAMVDSGLGLQMGEATISSNSKIAGKNLIESRLRQDFGIIIVAIKKADGNMKYNPTSDEILEEKDVIVMLGKRSDLINLKRVL